MRSLKRNMALAGATAVIAAAGLGGIMSAQADTSSTPGTSQTDTVQDGTEVEEAEDGPDQGPDANPNEPGHQDTDESGEAEGNEGTEVEEAVDGPDQGPDANPNEPGHQDANESGETE